MSIRKGQGGIIAIVFGCLVILGILVAFAGYDKVPASHLGVMEQFGHIKGVQEPGLKYTGILTTVEKYDLRTNKVVINLFGKESAFDNTGQAVYATVNVNYRIRPTHETVLSLYTQVGPSNIVADRLNLDAIVAEGFRQATVEYEALKILENQQDVKLLAKENIRNNFPTEYFEIQNIVISNIDFSQEFKDMIEAKKVAEQEALMEENLLEVVRFQQEQQILVYEAEAKKMNLQKMEVTELLNQQKWIEKWNGEVPMLMMASEATNGFLFQIPDMPMGEVGSSDNDTGTITTKDGVPYFVYENGIAVPLSTMY